MKRPFNAFQSLFHIIKSLFWSRFIALFRPSLLLGGDNKLEKQGRVVDNRLIGERYNVHCVINTHIIYVVCFLFFHPFANLFTYVGRSFFLSPHSTRSASCLQNCKRIFILRRSRENEKIFFSLSLFASFSVAVGRESRQQRNFPDTMMKRREENFHFSIINNRDV